MISINWLTKTIFVPQSFLTALGGLRYRLDVNAFRNALKDIEDSDDGMAHPDTHRHATESLLSGTTYARQFEVINGYTVEFENGVYQVECVGANHNIADVKVVNSVSLVIGNSAGLIVTSSGGGSGGGLTIEQARQLFELWQKEGLDPSASVTVTKQKITVGDPLAPDIEIALTGNLKTLTVMERQP